MFNSFEVWESFWKETSFDPICSPLTPHYPLLYGGVRDEPIASIGLCSFLEPVREKFKSGFSILDYGCGAGILANFISQRLGDFSYLGMEPESSHGFERIALGLTLLRDSRVNFGTISLHLDSCKDQKFDLITLISVFTHLTIEETSAILDTLIPFVRNHDSKIVFSCFIDDNYQLINKEPHINENFYGMVCLTEEQLEDYFKDKTDISYKKVCEFPATPQFIHHIYEVSKA